MAKEAIEKEEKQEKKLPKVKDVQRGVWSSEVISEVKYKAETGKHRIRGCGSTKKFPNFDDLLILPSQLSRLSIDTYREDCRTQTVLGARFAKKPLVIETPIMISGMSYGALSKEAKIALAKSTQIVGTSINNGEGGLLAEERQNSYKQVVQITPSRMRSKLFAGSVPNRGCPVI
jgi:glutamate synthase domain-containing protein 2